LLPCLFNATVYAFSLRFEDVGKSLLEVVDHGAKVVSFKLLLALLVEALHEVTEARGLGALAVLESTLEEVAEGALDVTMGNEVVSHGIHDGVFIQVPGIL
jgi:adenosylmethionine-8-amino-7-oxononanoate aminotransferase